MRMMDGGRGQISVIALQLEDKIKGLKADFVAEEEDKLNITKVRFPSLANPPYRRTGTDVFHKISNEAPVASSLLLKQRPAYLFAGYDEAV